MYNYSILHKSKCDTDKAYDESVHLHRAPVTPAVHPRRLGELLHFDIQSTGQKSHCVNTAHQGRR